MLSGIAIEVKMMSINVDPSTERTLSELAALKNVSMNVLLSDLAEAALRKAQVATLKADLQQAVEEGGHYTDEEVDAFLDNDDEF